MALEMCGACGRHHLTTLSACPHCGAARGIGGRSLTPAAALLGLALVACGGDDTTDDTGTIQALYGVPDSGQWDDNDQDGYSPADGDCDDEDETRHPGATETAGDGVDSDCDGEDDPATQ